MFGRRTFAGGIWKPKNPHSLEYLKYLHGVLNKNAVVTESNRGLLVEALRAIAEILIWGDQNDPSVFDFFLEKNMLGYFLRIMKQKCGRYVCTQLLQTLNILFENISNETSLYYLLSNNHVNSIITHRFDFSDEEILAYYISFLKTLSLKLNVNTIHFFFNEHTSDFPLYTEAIKFFNHSEAMVRIAVRTITLNVYRVNDPAMVHFIRENAAAPYFSNFVFFIVKHVMEMDACVSCSQGQSKDKLSHLLAEHLDHIHYVNDVLRLNIDSLNSLLTEQLVQKLLSPVYLASLSPDGPSSGTARVSQLTGLCLLSQVFLVFAHPPLVSRLAQLVLMETLDRGRCDGEDGTKMGPLLRVVLDNLCASSDDRNAFFALCLIYSLYRSPGLSSRSDQCASVMEFRDSPQLTWVILARLVDWMGQCVRQGPACRVRIVTLEACFVVLKELLALSSPETADRVAADLSSFRDGLVNHLRECARRADVFLDIFEEEYRRYRARNFSLCALSTDACMLMPTNSGIDSEKELEEHTRRCLGLFMLAESLIGAIKGEEDVLEDAFGAVPIVQVGQCLDLSSSDILACTVMAKDGSKCQRFLVTGGLQLMLVEPDGAKLGHGVVRSVGLLQDCRVTGDKEDSKALAVAVSTSKAGSFNVRLIFDDHIRCMAAKQRLTKGRQKARQYKMAVVNRLLRLTDSPGPPERAPFSAPALIASQSGGRVPGYVAAHQPDQTEHPSSPDQPSARSRRRVRVLSAESVNPSAGENIRMKEVQVDGDPKRSNSLSPRVVPRFGVSAEEPAGSTSMATSVIVLGMAGSGKSTLVQRLVAREYDQHSKPYVVNLDPAVLSVSYPANIDIRDTVNYAQVMKQYNLGPNGAIMTCLNLFTTRFDQVANLLEKHRDCCQYAFFDTPGQIEVFTWSASGGIITETLASLSPTVVVYVMDVARSVSPVTFMSNMLYACSILYKTRLPFVVALNKVDLVDPTNVVQWMTDYEKFGQALEEEKDYISDLTRSLSLALDEFYSGLKCVKVSAVTGDGVEELFVQLRQARQEYERDYAPEYQRLRKEKDAANRTVPEVTEKLGSVNVDDGGDD